MTKLEAFLLIAKHKQMLRFFQVFTWLRITWVVVTKSVEIDCEQKEGGYLQRRRRQTTAEYCDKISNLRGLRFIFVQKWKEYLSLCTFLKCQLPPERNSIYDCAKMLFIKEKHISTLELENVKSFTRTNINKPDFTPRKARKSRHFWHFKPTKQKLWGFLW